MGKSTGLPSYAPVTLFDSYANIKTYLQDANNMGNKLSIQLLTTMFNVFLGKVDATTSIYAPAISGSQSLTHRPDLPCWPNFHGEPSSLPPPNRDPLNGLPSAADSFGL